MLTAERMTVRDIARERGLSKSAVNRLQRKARGGFLNGQSSHARIRIEARLSRCPTAMEWDSVTVLVSKQP